MPQQQQTLNRTVVFEECFVCGIPIAMSKGQLRQFNEMGMTIHCVMGHRTVRRKSDVQILEEKLQEAQDRVTALETDLLNETAISRELTAKHKKMKDRIHKGVCPNCRRSFQNVQRHMARQHPEAVAR